MSTVLVTGAAGFIGSHSCDRLLALGHTVVGVDNFRTGKRENLAAALRHSAFSLVEADVAEPNALTELVARATPDAIVHLAALVSVPQSIEEPALNFRLNVEATQRLIEALRVANAKGKGPGRSDQGRGTKDEGRRAGETNDQGQKTRDEGPRTNDRGPIRVVFASSAAVYGDNPELPLTERSETRPMSPYGGAKLASEALLLGAAAATGYTVRCLRYFNVFGPRQDPKSPYSGVISIFAEKFAAKAAPTIFGDGEQTRDFISVHDVARANVLAATTPALANGITNICTGQPTTLNRLATVMRSHVTGAPTPVHATVRAGDIRHSLGAPDRARAELQFSAAVSLEDGLRELVSRRS